MRARQLLGFVLSRQPMTFMSPQPARSVEERRAEFPAHGRKLDEVKQINQ